MQERRRGWLSKLVMGAVVSVVGGAVLLIAPPVFTDTSGTGFRFGEPEMRAAIEGTWTLEVPQAGATPRALTFTIQQAGAPARASLDHGWIRSAAACGHRSFIKSAEACLDVSRMQLKLVTAGGDRRTGTGQLQVLGKNFSSGRLELQLDGLDIRADVSSAGAVTNTVANESPARLTRLRARS